MSFKLGKYGQPARAKSRMTFTARSKIICCFTEDEHGTNRRYRQMDVQQFRRAEEREWKREAIEGIVDSLEDKRNEKYRAFFENWDKNERQNRDQHENPEGYSFYTSESEHAPGCMCNQCFND